MTRQEKLRAIEEGEAVLDKHSEKVEAALAYLEAVDAGIKPHDPAAVQSAREAVEAALTLEVALERLRKEVDRPALTPWSRRKKKLKNPDAAAILRRAMGGT